MRIIQYSVMAEINVRRDDDYRMPRLRGA